jgi:hypothetical protein
MVDVGRNIGRFFPHSENKPGNVVIRWEDTNINKFTYENCEVYILGCGVSN